MNLKDITLVLGVDAKHLEELRFVWPGWMKYKPELRDMPCVVFYDVHQVQECEMDFLQEHPQVRLIAWELPNARNQREKMLTGFVQIPAREVVTPWYLKIDTDAAATGPGEWIKPEWFAPDEQGELPVFITSPWGYTKPRYAMDVMDDWADGVPLLAARPRLNLPYSSKSNKMRHPRIISWLFFGRADWTREMASLLPADGRLPVPSQDTYLFYCAMRLGKTYRRPLMAEHHWQHGRVSIIRSQEHAMGQKPPKIRDRSPKAGVVYYNSGTSCAVRLLVSLSSLRKHYRGRVAILSEGKDSHRLCRKIAKALSAEVIEWDSGVAEGKNMPFLAKTRLHLGTPFETTVALDSDTLVTGPLDELFALLEKEEFCVAQLSDWRTNGRIIQNRLSQWSDLFPEWVEQAVSFGPAVNIGVIAFQRNARLFNEWYGTAVRGREHFIPDEVSCQLLLPRYPHRILDGRWNRSCRHDDPALPDTRVIHYHGKKHCRPGLPFHADRWMESFQFCHSQNLARVRQWLPAGDRILNRYLKSNPEALRTSDDGHTSCISAAKTRF